MTGVQLNSGIQTYVPIEHSPVASVAVDAPSWELSDDGQRRQSQLIRMLGAPLDAQPSVEQVSVAIGRRDNVIAALRNEVAQPWVTEAWEKMSPEQRQACEDVYQQAMLAMRDLDPQSELSATPKVHKTAHEMFDDLVAPVVKSQEKLKIYTEIVANYSTLYPALTEIDMNSFLGDVDDKGNQKINLDKLWAAVTKVEAGVKPLKSFKTKAEADKWQKIIGNGTTVKSDGKGGFDLYPDMAPITAIKTAITAAVTDDDGKRRPTVNGFVTLNAGQYAALTNKIDTQISNVQNTMQMLTTQLGRENSLADSTVKIMTSSMSALLDMFKSFLRL